MVEIFFGIITRQAIRRGTFASVKDLVTAIETFIDGWNERCEPFVWTKTADEVVSNAVPHKKTSDTRHTPAQRAARSGPAAPYPHEPTKSAPAMTASRGPRRGAPGRQRPTYLIVANSDPKATYDTRH